MRMSSKLWIADNILTSNWLSTPNIIKFDINVCTLEKITLLDGVTSLRNTTVTFDSDRLVFVSSKLSTVSSKLRYIFVHARFLDIFDADEMFCGPMIQSTPITSSVTFTSSRVGSRIACFLVSDGFTMREYGVEKFGRCSCFSLYLSSIIHRIEDFQNKP